MTTEQGAPAASAPEIRDFRMVIGGETVAALESALVRGGWDAVCLSVVASNERGRRFWERLGYREIPDAWHAYNGHRPVEIVMRHAIGRGAAAG